MSYYLGFDCGVSISSSPTNCEVYGLAEYRGVLKMWTVSLYLYI